MQIASRQTFCRSRRWFLREYSLDRSTSQLCASMLVEPLEGRLCLSTAAITDVIPAANSPAAARDSQIVISFDAPILTDSLSDRSLIVHSEKTGRIAIERSDLTVDANQIVWNPQRPFVYGDEIQVTAGAGLHTRQGESVSPSVWQFRVASNPGAVLFNQLDSTLAGRIVDLKLGDVDSDDDLDMVVMIRHPVRRVSEVLVFQNDGLANFHQIENPIPDSQIRYVDLADIDGDGDLDIVSGDSDATRVYLNDSTGDFSESHDLIYGANEIAIGDLNQDGYMDIYVAADHTNQVWLQSASSPGSFEYVIQALGTTESTDVVLGDLDHDGDLDALVLNRHDSRVWLNDATGRFHDSGQRLDKANRVELGDLDGDGDLDFLTDGGRKWLNNDHFPGFFQRQHGQALRSANDAALGDFDGDGDLDSVVGTDDANVFLMNNGSGALRVNRDVLVQRQSSVVAVGDLDGDGDLDVVTAGRSESAARQGRLTILTNVDIPSDLSIDVQADQSQALPGSEVRFTVQASNHGPQPAEQVLVTLDVPGSLIDLQISCAADPGASCSTVQNGRIRDLIRLPAQSTVTFTITAHVDRLTVGSLELRGSIADPTGLVDVGLKNNVDAYNLYIATRTVHPVANTVINARPTFLADFTSPIERSTISSSAFVIHGSQSGSMSPAEQTLTAEGRSLRLAADSTFLPGETVQLSMPGHLLRQDDQANLGAQAQQYRVSTSGGTGLFRRTSMSFGRQGVAVGDLDRDGDLDVVTVGSSSAIYYNDGHGRFEQFQPIGQEANSAALGDLDGDGDLDIVFAEYRGHSRVWINQQDDRFEPIPAPAIEDLRNRNVQLADIDGDGDLDVLSIGDQSSLLSNDGTANFSETEQLGDVSSAFVADFDSDGRMDMLLDDQLWRNIGKARFARSAINRQAYDVGDVDGEGNVDLIGSSGVSINDGQGRFHSRRTPNVFDRHSRLGDIDGDDDLDVVSPDGVWINNGQAEFSALNQDFPPYARNQPILGDFDGDGDLDMILKDDDFELWINADIPADLSVEIPASQTFVLPGQAIEFELIVRNDGPQDTFGVRLQDVFPSEFTDASWRCEATVGSACSASGRGDILDDLNLLADGVASYTVSAKLADDASGWIRNMAVVSTGANGSLDDFDPGNDAVTEIFIVPQVHVTPARNSHDIDQNPRFTLTFENAAQGDGLSASDVIVHGFQSGGIDIVGFSVDASTVAFQLSRDFKASEQFEVTVRTPSAVLDDSPVPHVIRARFGTEVARAHFVPRGEFQESLRQVAPGDFDGDGDLDLIVARSRPQLLLNDGFGNFEQSSEDFGHDPDHRVSAKGISVADVDQDGDLDVLFGRVNVRVAAPDDRPTIGAFLWRNDGQGRFMLEKEALSQFGNYDATAMSDLDGDGDVDAILSDRWRTYVLLNDGGGRFEDTGQVLPGAAERHWYRSRIAIGDLDGDDDMDLAYRGQILSNDGTGTFIVSQNLGSLARTELGDVDGDGDLDLFAGGALWRNNGGGDFRPSNVNLGHAVTLRDMDGDGDLDALSESLWVNDGHGNFRQSGQFFYQRILALADVDGDRDLDAVSAGAILFNTPVVGDVNADGVFGALDLVAALQAGRYLERFSEPRVRYDEGDFNQDGRFNQLDLVFALQFGPFNSDGDDGE